MLLRGCHVLWAIWSQCIGYALAGVSGFGSSWHSVAKICRRSPHSQLCPEEFGFLKTPCPRVPEFSTVLLWKSQQTFSGWEPFPVPWLLYVISHGPGACADDFCLFFFKILNSCPIWALPPLHGLFGVNSQLQRKPSRHLLGIWNEIIYYWNTILKVFPFLWEK